MIEVVPVVLSAGCRLPGVFRWVYRFEVQEKELRIERARHGRHHESRPEPAALRRRDLLRQLPYVLPRVE
ncbi:MAG: hypothetical protein WD628_01615, partial [Thermomicrobiales bacterium]